MALIPLYPTVPAWPPVELSDLRKNRKLSHLLGLDVSNMDLKDSGSLI